MGITTKSQDIAKSFLKKQALTLKMAGIFILILVLLTPLSMIRGILSERMGRFNEAVAGITEAWGGEQIIVGPALVIPYQHKVKTWKEQIINGKQDRIEVEEDAISSAFFLPSDLNIEGAMTPSTLHRGIYNAVVYSGKLAISGQFSPPDFSELGIADEDVRWQDAMVTLAVSDLRGTGQTFGIKMGDKKYMFTPGCRLNGYTSGVTARLPNYNDKGTSMAFQLDLNLKGSRGIRFAPVGQQNKVKLTSPWIAPSFRGTFLPTDRKLNDKGFEASWEVSWYGRSYPQQSAGHKESALTAQAIVPSLFGVDFISLIDKYRMVERATKYGVLFITLIFTVFFLFEVLSSLHINTIQYVLVGAALCLFYLAVLSLSEFVPFGLAYWIGVAASSLLIILYCLGVLKSGKKTAIIAAALLITYTYLYVALQLQDYSLLFGTAGLFVILGILMYITRNIDWSTREDGVNKNPQTDSKPDVLL